MRRHLALFALPAVALALASTVMGCSFDDKHEKYPEPGDKSIPVTQARDPEASSSAKIPGWELAPPETKKDDPIVPPTYYAGPGKGAQPRPGASSK